MSQCVNGWSGVEGWRGAEGEGGGRREGKGREGRRREVIGGGEDVGLYGGERERENERVCVYVWV